MSGVTDQQAVYWASPKVHIWSLQQAPVPAFVVSDVRLHLLIHLLVCQEYPFDTCYLGRKERDAKPGWAEIPVVLEILQKKPPDFLHFI